VDRVGATLREERQRQGIELGEIERTTKIRGRFLAAIEAEDWDVLPGDAYARGFVRTYADHLGLDGARLAAEAPPVPTPPVAAERAPRRRSRRVLTAALALGLVALIGVVGLIWDTGGGGSTAGPGRPAEVGGTLPRAAGTAPVESQRAPDRVDTGRGPIELSLRTTAEVWVCLLDQGGRPLVEGIVLPGGAEEGPFRSGSFTVSLGNGEVAMRVDGKETEIPQSASPLGYQVGGGGELTPLPESERPTCL
jgi:Helix-turn-helix domain